MVEPVDRAVHLFEIGRYEEALAAAARALAEQAEQRVAMRLVVLCQLNLDRLPEALAAANRLVVAYPDRAEGHRLASVVLQRMHHPAEAHRAAATAVGAEPLDPANHVQFALTAKPIRGHARVARAAAARAVELDPHDDDAHFAVGFTARSSEGQRAAYRRALAINPHHSAARNNLQVARGHAFSLTSLARGYLGVLEDDPSYETARHNLVGLTYRFVRRFYWCGLAMVVVGIVVAGPGWTPVGLAIGVLALLAMAWYGVVTVRAVPPGPRAFLLRAWRSRAHLIATTVHTALVVLCGLVVLTVPGGPTAGAVAFFPLILANLALAAWGAASRTTR